MGVGLKNFQKSFQNALIGKNSEISRFIKPGEMTIKNRIKVYQEDYFYRLRDSLEEDYPALRCYLGEFVFEEIVRAYLNKFPSSSFSLRDLGCNLPKFLKDHYEDPRLEELAQFETNLISCLYEKNEKLLNLDSLRRIPLENWPDLVFRLQSSLKTVQCHYNTLDYVLSVSRGNPCVLELLSQPVETLIWRFKEEVFFRGLSKEEFALFSGLKEALPFSELCEKMLSFFSEKEVISWVSSLLQGWINEGIFSDF